jgi:hypothetical protein
MRNWRLAMGSGAARKIVIVFSPRTTMTFAIPAISPERRVAERRLQPAAAYELLYGRRHGETAAPVDYDSKEEG